ncbi:MAG: dprA [Actinotalea sp.]|nr:dprA [Actinotalea sp.]
MTTSGAGRAVDDGAPSAARGRAASDEEIIARAAWSRLSEPGDLVAGAVLAALGPVDALDWLREIAGGGTFGAGRAGWVRPPTVTSAAADETDRSQEGVSSRRLTAAVARWMPRLSRLDPEADLRMLERIGGRFLVPGGPGWPSGLGDLQAGAPPGLWVRGHLDLSVLAERSVALIGARACSAYGEHVTGDLASGVADRGWTVVSGGAFGIDAVAHRAALATGGPTVAVLAGGVDRPYPAGNARLLSAIVDRGGAVVCEVPPGSVPSKVRFLQRNRLIAAMTCATVVVEAAWRSGALNTAGHAASLGRPVGAVPGAVTSAASAGCHRLLREGAVCVTDADEVMDLAGGLGVDLAPARTSASRAGDDLPDTLRRCLDALPVRRGASADSVARVAGLSLPEIRAALGSLELGGLAVQDGGLWRRAARTTAEPGRTGQGPPRATT